MRYVSRAALLAAVVAAVVATPASAARNAVYGGTTAKREAIAITADSKAGQLKAITLVWEARCGDGTRFPVALPLTAEQALPGFDASPLTLVTTRNAGGRFAGTQTGFMPGAHGGGGAITTEVNGKLSKTAASGTMKGSVAVFDDAGSQVTTCATGAVRFAAGRKPGVIYAGATAQGEPVVVRLNAAGTQVSNFMTGWWAACKPEGAVRFTEDYRFRLRAGRFNATFSEAYPFDDGGRAELDYAFKGAVTRTTAKGSLAVERTETGPDGSQSTCDSGRVSWSAKSG